MAARITPWKGQLIAIRAMTEVVRRLPDAQLLIAGAALFGKADQQYERLLRAETANRSLTSNVQFLGHVDDPIAFYESVDIGLLCSTDPEPFGKTVLDAMAAGRPVIVSNHGGVMEIVSGTSAGVSVAPGDPYALALGVLALAAEGRASLRRRGNAAKAHVRQFDVSVIAPQFAKFYWRAAARVRDHEPYGR
jgi:glycosyltransferase involved in cell wall biosynthesis